MMRRMQAPVSEPAMMTGSWCDVVDVWLVAVVTYISSMVVTINVLFMPLGDCSSAGSDAVRKTQTHCGYNMYKYCIHGGHH